MKTKCGYIGALQNTGALNMVNWDGPHKERDSDTEQWVSGTCRMDRLSGLLEKGKMALKLSEKGGGGKSPPVIGSRTKQKKETVVLDSR